MIAAAMWPNECTSHWQALVSLLGNLAFYNDKGIDICRHSREEQSRERAEGLARIRSLVDAIGRQHVPQEFLAALDSGDLAEDGSGRWVGLLESGPQRPD